MTKKRINPRIKKILYINLGVMGLSLAFSIFLSTNNLVVGGVGGIAINVIMLYEKIASKTLDASTADLFKSIIILSLNVLSLLVSLILLNKRFTINTIYCTFAYPIYTWIFSRLLELLKLREVFTLDLANAGEVLIFIIFASLLAGVSIGIVLKNGASTGGLDIVEQINLQYFKIPYSFTILCIDGITVLISAFLFKDVFVVFYGVIYIVLCGKIIDSIVFGGFKSYSVTIITNHSEEMRELILKNIDRGLTIVDAEGGYTGNDMKMLVCILSRGELNKIRGLVKEIDDTCFMYVTRTAEVSGIGFTRDKDYGRNK